MYNKIEYKIEYVEKYSILLIRYVYLYPMKKLHHRQSSILELLKNNVDNPLTLIALSQEVGIDSPGVLYHHLRQLERKGYLKRNPNNPKDYIVLDAPEKKVAYINKYGMAQCGPNGSILDGTPIEQIPIASALLRFPVAEAFIVEARGDSMEPKIHEGDTIIARKQSQPESGDIIVCVHEQAAIIKQFIRIGKRVILHSLNEKHELIEIRSETEFKIEGVVKNILSTL